DIAGITAEEYAQARFTIFAEPPVDIVYDEYLDIPEPDKVFAMEYLPGQYDQRADSAAQCLQILTQKDRSEVSSAKVIILQGEVSEAEFTKIKEFCINPVESREAALNKPKTLHLQAAFPEEVKVLTGFIDLSAEKISDFNNEYGLAMSIEDLLFCQAYFRDTEKRNPTVTEIRVIDTYWSDHCRHTTFSTKLAQIEFDEGRFNRGAKRAYADYLAARQTVYGEKVETRDITLMDVAVIGMKSLKQQGKLADLDESDEINACSIVVEAEINGQAEEWLVMFKNETHNHPTEIEPFGGAATCLGGAIRDPLSGRTYVYQAMRVTGSSDPRTAIKDTLPGKLPQKKITTGAALGYSSYGNQIGLATGQVAEVYDPGFVAKRMEIGAVIAAAPRKNVVRKSPVPGDIVLLVGGRTGRDGCGGATGSSKEHNLESLLACGAEVQKGNAPVERKIQRLFRHPELSTLIKRCNDFGAGGVSVAVGELTAGLVIDLDAVPKKYDGLDGTELAISESQERMAVVIAPEDLPQFEQFAALENVECTVVAKVTADRRLKMVWRRQAIVDLARDFLDTNGVQQTAAVRVKAPSASRRTDLPAAITANRSDLHAAWLANLADLNVCSKKGLVERFDSTIGAGTLLMPFGGRYQLTPSDGMAAKLPVLRGDTTTATLMSYGYNPVLAKWSPFHGALYAVIEAVSKIVTMGGDYRRVRLTLQEYFEKLGTDATKWGKPFSALLGAFYAQNKLEIPAIGGKDSMSGTFMELDVPPTLVAFAVNVVNSDQVVSQEFKQPESQVVLVRASRDEEKLPDFNALMGNFAKVTELVREGKVLAAKAVSMGGLAATLSEMAFGNQIGLELTQQLSLDDLFRPDYGAMVLELPAALRLAEEFGNVDFTQLGVTLAKPVIMVNGVTVQLAEAREVWEKPLERIFPAKTGEVEKPPEIRHEQRNTHRPAVKLAKPRILIPVFPGTNCEYDSARAFEKAGGVVDTLVIRNLTAQAVEETVRELAKKVDNSQIVMLPGGFSAGDEPDGSGKFIATMFRNPRVKAAIQALLNRRDGLMLGICNGFQALIKLGLLPYGEITDITEDSPTLTFNKIGRHVSCMAQTKVVSTLSPWFSDIELGDVYTIPMSHGEGRFVASDEVLARLIDNGQIATQYVDLAGVPSADNRFNPNGSVGAVEGITSPDGRILGKMGHSERCGERVVCNIPGEKYQPIFAGGVKYFS
ncbi:MAG TPA: phosphoribosylformylglycinamidine synthase, partial [Desulfobacteria bacterium]|nr:phosphoribosylformylglycinamidine synthase [Desulfobacteria bacterium]